MKKYKTVPLDPNADVRSESRPVDLCKYSNIYYTFIVLIANITIPLPPFPAVRPESPLPPPPPPVFFPPHPAVPVLIPV